MTKQVLRWKIQKEMESAGVMKQSAERANNKAKELLADGMIVAFQTVLKNIDEYKAIEKDFKERRV